MKWLSVKEMRAADRATMALPGFSGMYLMNRAGLAVARVAERMATQVGTRSILCVAGKGNNGGDAFVAARLLHEAGFSVRVLMTASPEEYQGDAAVAFSALEKAGIPFSVHDRAEEWRGEWVALPSGIIVDGILGTGCDSAPRGVAAEAIRWVNSRRRTWRILSIDIPSGMNGDTGTVAGEVVHADATITLARPKGCFLNREAWSHVGHLEVDRIGMPDSIADSSPLDLPCELIVADELADCFPERPREAHKGNFGRIAIVGGSQPYPHAPVLAGIGALKSGAGLLTLVVPAESRMAAAVHIPEAMISERPTASCGSLSGNSLVEMNVSRFDALLVGPGLTRHVEAEQLLSDILHSFSGKLVIDADALALLGKWGSLPVETPERQERILTPHPGEAALLAGVSVDEIQGDRLGWVRKLADRYRSTVILKGAGSTICQPGGRPWINLTGNPGMACGGMGDLLAGMVTALWAGGLPALTAASAAVWAHGTAGDRVALKEGQTALTATALSEELGAAFLSITR